MYHCWLENLVTLATVIPFIAYPATRSLLALNYYISNFMDCHYHQNLNAKLCAMKRAISELYYTYGGKSSRAANGTYVRRYGKKNQLLLYETNALILYLTPKAATRTTIRTT